MNLRDEPTDRSDDRTLDLAGLKALSHPLRIQLLEQLSQLGPQTASSLAASLGESSGATSYHLRQLAKHSLVREVEGRGSARERWWERPPGALTLFSKDLAADPAALHASKIVNREIEHHRAVLLQDFMEQGYEFLPENWFNGSVIATMNARLTAEQLAEVTEEMLGHARALLEKYRVSGTTDPNARAVQMHFNAFPILQGQFDTPVQRDNPS
ncbi:MULTISPECIES: ArsR/SmtB family transcription factor [unclassified Arthrobacter]|uniref:ArsR/SmtB family transcription factor n=1 Tax=unclassified Arthrobacter TaxID=235627 RepID=UPI00149123CC|nr:MULTISPECIES: helix-turn-helix domain-containing protein [unclassified Arthrobacter]MBE0008879.1 ArsR family transcriptional regulator [Arthrobacter sp. AET 35A]NOJ62641.1 helix-turn-helix transcriptional regulator [Arthrobacter sp. 147(2020)]